MAEVPGPSEQESGKTESGIIDHVPTFETGTPADTGPKFEAPTAEEQAAQTARAAEARQAVEASATPLTTEQQLQNAPRSRDAEGGNDHWGYNGGDRAAHQAENSTARDNLDRLNSIPTAAEKAQMRADMATKPKSAVGRFFDRIRGRG